MYVLIHQPGPLLPLQASAAVAPGAPATSVRALWWLAPRFRGRNRTPRPLLLSRFPFGGFADLDRAGARRVEGDDQSDRCKPLA